MVPTGILAFWHEYLNKFQKCRGQGARQRRDLTAACARHRRMFFCSALFSGAMLPCQRGPLTLEASPGAPQVTSLPSLAALPPRLVRSLIADLDPGSAPVQRAVFLITGMWEMCARTHLGGPCSAW